MIEFTLAAYLVIGIGWAVWTEPQRKDDLDNLPSEITVFAFMSAALSWFPEVMATVYLYAVHGADWPDRPA